jgi:hypothetical protein
VPLLDANTAFGYWANRDGNPSLESLLATWTKHKVEAGCSLSTTGLFLDSAQGNQLTLEAGRQHPALLPVATFDPRYCADPMPPLTACLESGFRVFALFPETQGWPLGVAQFTEIPRRLAGKARALMVEASAPGAATAAVRGLGETDLPMVLMGTNLENLAEALCLARQDPRIYLETHRLSSTDSVELAVEQMGPDRLLFGSGAPRQYFSSAHLLVRYAGIEEADRDKIFGGNLARLLDWSPPA